MQTLLLSFYRPPSLAYIQDLFIRILSSSFYVRLYRNGFSKGKKPDLFWLFLPLFQVMVSTIECTMQGSLDKPLMDYDSLVVGMERFHFIQGARIIHKPWIWTFPLFSEVVIILKPLQTNGTERIGYSEFARSRCVPPFKVCESKRCLF